MSWRLGWWEALAFTHRWLGIAGCLLFLLWFVSGIAMMYVRMPELTAEERFAHLSVLDAAAITVSVADAAAVVGAPATSAQLTMLGTRPVYHFGDRPASVVFADDAERLEDVSEERALALARVFASDPLATLRYIGLVSNPDQWTLQSRAYFPLHHLAPGDEAGTEI